MSGTIAVLEPGAAWAAVPGKSPMRIPWKQTRTLYELLGLAAGIPAIRQVWIHASALAWCGLPSAPGLENAWALGDPYGWEVHGSRSPLAWWFRGRHDVSRETVAIAIPEYNRTEGVWGCWREIETAQELAAQLGEFIDAVGILPIAGPGRTAEALLRKLAAKSKYWQDLAGAIMPEPAFKGPREADMVWMRPLDERATVLIAYDRNAHYLGPLGGLSIGLGAPQRMRTLPSGNLPPGYWHAEILSEVPAMQGLPDPFPMGKMRWYTTATIELAREFDAQITIDDGWAWFEHHRLLEPFYERMRRARREGNRVTRDAVKSMYTQMIGRMESKLWDRSSDTLYRPDIRQMTIAKARANFWRSLAKSPRRPVLVYVDEAIYAAAPLNASAPGLENAWAAPRGRWPGGIQTRGFPDHGRGARGLESTASDPERDSPSAEGANRWQGLTSNSRAAWTNWPARCKGASFRPANILRRASSVSPVAAT